ncbi:MAG TPA: DNA repair protein RecN [Actinomycetota bacterium]|nr:DNA repair protein RecN [Actinomycetota bacterium]
MLRELHISGLGVIADLDLELAPGLNVLTGETGAGKTMVTVGLLLALGERGSASLVRDGARAARVQARFDATDEAGDWAEDGEVILARSVARDGRSTARIGGQLATASALARLGAALLEHHGQGLTQRLLAPAAQTSFVDRFAGDEHVVALAAYREVHDRLREAGAELETLREAGRGRERELDLLRFQIAEIEAVDPRDGESEELASEEARLAHVERLTEQAAVAEQALTGDGGIDDAAASVASVLEAAGTLDPGASDVASRARGIAAEIAELARDVRNYGESLVPDPGRLQAVRERIGALKQLQRKYGTTDAEVIGFLAETSARLAALEGADDRIGDLEAEVERLAGLATGRAATVTAGRRAAADTLATAVRTELEELGMPGATFEVRLEPLEELGPAGAERAELWFSPDPRQPARPVAKAASGGERSRVMLACRSVLADLDDVGTLVFDEIDAGIGGEAGLAVGRRLALLAAGRQVLVVTHLPQIACFADRHLHVTKAAGAASVELLDDAGRADELSRMLAGLPGSESAVTHAEELLAEAHRLRSRAPAAAGRAGPVS